MSSPSPTTSAHSKVALPFKRVVIYKNGVAYFEREGKVEGNCSLDLYFKPSEMNDIIRSLRVVDLNGGKIANISYGSAINNEEKPASTIAGTNQAIFGSLIGSNVRIIQNDEKEITGRIMGTYESSEGHTLTRIVELVVDDSRIHFIKSNNIASMEVIDKHVTVSMKQNLDSALDSKKQDKRQVSIICKGQGSRAIRVSYILENPIWKSNYRIFMKGGETKQFYLEGWACVDNTSESDWDEVSLSLVCGSPISFQHEMYHPIIGIRPSQFSDEGKLAQNITQVQKNNAPRATNLNAYPSYNSPYSNNNMNTNPFGYPPQQQRLQQMQQQQQAMQQMQSMQQMQTPPMTMNQMQPNLMDMFGTEGGGMDLDTQTVEIGNLFHYEIQTPISVKKGHSSLVPTVSGEFKGRKICWFDPKRHAVNAMECIMLKNTLGAILDKGPIIIAEDDNYLGESIIENTMMQDEHKLLPYSVNLECKVSLKNNNSQTPKSTTIKNVYKYHTVTHCHESVYTLTNNSEHEIELALDHEQRVTTKIEVAKAQADWKTGTRFYVILPPLRKTNFTIPVKTDRAHINQSILSISRNDYASWHRSGYITVQVFNALHKLYSDAYNVSKAKHHVVEEKKREEQIISDQKRVQGLAKTVQNDNFSKQISVLEAQLAQSRVNQNKLYDTWQSAREACIVAINALIFTLDMKDVEPYDVRAATIDNTQVSIPPTTTFNDLLSDQDKGRQLEPPTVNFGASADLIF